MKNFKNIIEPQGLNTPLDKLEYLMTITNLEPHIREEIRIAFDEHASQFKGKEVTEEEVREALFSFVSEKYKITRNTFETLLFAKGSNYNAMYLASNAVCKKLSKSSEYISRKLMEAEREIYLLEQQVRKLESSLSSQFKPKEGVSAEQIIRNHSKCERLGERVDPKGSIWCISEKEAMLMVKEALSLSTPLKEVTEDETKHDVSQFPTLHSVNSDYFKCSGENCKLKNCVECTNRKAIKKPLSSQEAEKDLKGITNESLIKLGGIKTPLGVAFTIRKTEYVHSTLQICYNNDTSEVSYYVYFMDNYLDTNAGVSVEAVTLRKDLKYIHEVKDLYFALTGKQLI